MDVNVRDPNEDDIRHAVRGVSYSVKKGETIGIVGESGSGKSTAALSIMRLLPKPHCRIEGGQIFFNGIDLMKLKPDEMRSIRGRKIAMIFQEPMTALNPVRTIGSQLSEMYELHIPGMKKKDILETSINLMEEVGIQNPGQKLNEYPHQLSGGMRQRVMIAMALSCKPDVLIADEPTSALDVTIQAQILSMMKKIQKDYGMAIIFISHDFDVIAEVCDHIYVMYGGVVVEEAKRETLFKGPRHPYTKGLLRAIPRLDSVPKSRLFAIKGAVPGLSEINIGCPFLNRCSIAIDECAEKLPDFSYDDTGEEKGHKVRCFNWKKDFKE